MKAKSVEEIVVSAIIALVCVCLLGTIVWQASKIEKPANPTDELWSIEEGAKLDVFTDFVNGISLEIPKNMQVDMEYSSVRTVLYDDNQRIEVYKQSLENTTFENYVAYSNRFVDEENLSIICQESVDWNGEKAKALIWKREYLSKLEKDFCYYANVEFPPFEKSQNAFTVFVKSGVPLKSIDDIQYILDGFKILDDVELKDAYTRISKAVDVKNRNWNSETKEFYKRHFDEKAELTWGIFEPQTAKFDYSQMEKYEESLEYEFPVLVNYTEVDKEKHKNLKERLETAWEHKNSVLELTLQMVQNDEKNMLYGILNGEYDEFLYDYAEVIADFGHPVVFRPMNEMNGDWCVYSAYHTSKDTEIYKAVYQYIYGIFEETGANVNTIWVWNPNSASYPGFQWNHPLMYYPGDEYVDLIGLTAYNTGAYYHVVGENWKEFQELYEELYNTYLDWFNQPFIITEFASASFGGDKAAWMESMFAQLGGYEKIKMAIWWDGCDWDVYGNVARAYFLDENKDCIDIFKKGIHGEIAANVNISENGKVKSKASYNTAYDLKKLESLIIQLAKDKRAAFLKETTIEELKGIGGINTRPDWLEKRKDGTYGYSKEKLQSLIAAGYTADDVKAEEVKNPGHSVEEIANEGTSENPNQNELLEQITGPFEPVEGDLLEAETSEGKEDEKETVNPIGKDESESDKTSVEKNEGNHATTEAETSNQNVSESK